MLAFIFLKPQRGYSVNPNIFKSINKSPHVLEPWALPSMQVQLGLEKCPKTPKEQTQINLAK